jgi:hypothetical protein
MRRSVVSEEDDRRGTGQPGFGAGPTIMAGLFASVITYPLVALGMAVCKLVVLKDHLMDWSTAVVSLPILIVVVQGVLTVLMRPVTRRAGQRLGSREWISDELISVGVTAAAAAIVLVPSLDTTMSALMSAGVVALVVNGTLFAFLEPWKGLPAGKGLDGEASA